MPAVLFPKNSRQSLSSSVRIFQKTSCIRRRSSFCTSLSDHPYSVSAAPVPAELKPPALPALFIVFQRFPHKLFCSLILKEFLNSVLVIISQTISVHRIEITGICPCRPPPLRTAHCRFPSARRTPEGYPRGFRCNSQTGGIYGALPFLQSFSITGTALSETFRKLPAVSEYSLPSRLFPRRIKTGDILLVNSIRCFCILCISPGYVPTRSGSQL